MSKEIRNAYKILNGKSHVNKPLGRDMHNWEGNITTDCEKKTNREDVRQFNDNESHENGSKTYIQNNFMY